MLSNHEQYLSHLTTSELEFPVTLKANLVFIEHPGGDESKIIRWNAPVMVSQKPSSNRGCYKFSFGVLNKAKCRALLMQMSLFDTSFNNVMENV